MPPTSVDRRVRGQVLRPGLSLPRIPPGIPTYHWNVLIPSDRDSPPFDGGACASIDLRIVQELDPDVNSW